MRMLNECLDYNRAKSDIEAFESRKLERQAMIMERKEHKGEFGNRKERRAEQSRRRKLERV